MENINHHDIDDEDHPFQRWYPRDILARTNWLYRVDALRPHDRREMTVIAELTILF